MVIKRTALLAAFQQADSAVYFATADGQHEYFGFGQVATLMNPSLTELADFQAKQSLPIFGGLPFFSNQHDQVGLMSGYFVVPAWVIDYPTGTTWGRQPKDLARAVQPPKKIRLLQQHDETDWVSRMTAVVDEMQRDRAKEKVVLGMQRELIFNQPLDPGQLIADLAQQQPQAYRIIIKRGSELFVSATPERLVAVNGRSFATAAVAGSIRRGNDSKTDEQLAKQLQHDPKNLHEHALVVRRLKEQLMPVADLNYPCKPSMLKGPQIQHLYTPIAGKLKAAVSLVDLIRVLHPTPALGGVPREWALDTIRELETSQRGLFAGPIGYMLPDGRGEFVVGIRSLWAQDRQVRLFAGAGILAVSDLGQEAQEIRLKMSVMMKLVEGQVKHG